MTDPFDTFNSTRMFNIVTEIQKRKAVENVFNGRATMLQDATQKILQKHAEFSSEIELGFDIEKIKEILQQYMAAHEERILIAKDKFELKRVREQYSRSRQSNSNTGGKRA